VAEGARLESVYTGNRIVGSNPTPSAKLPRNVLQLRELFARSALCPSDCPSGLMRVPPKSVL
jgi:hypothetical protein